MNDRSKLVCALGVGLVWLALAAAGCEDTKTLNSACPDGICPLAASSGADACLVTSTNKEVGWQHDPTTGKPNGPICYHQLARNDAGLVDMRVVVALTSPSDHGKQCSDFPFLKPASTLFKQQHALDIGTAVACEVNQLAVEPDADGGVAVAAGEGFYFDDWSASLATSCPYDHAGAQLVGSASVHDFLAIYSGTVTSAVNGETSDLMCEALAGSKPVGTPCLPDVDVVHQGDAVIQTRSNDCGQGLCMVYHLEGDISSNCKPAPRAVQAGDTSIYCADPVEIKKRAYCTCRCDAPSGAADACTCPRGFSCMPVNGATNSELVGSYCAKTGTRAEERAAP